MSSISFLCTNTRNWGRYDDSGYHVIDECPVGYYGITWDEGKVYVAEKVSIEQNAEAQHSKTKLIMYLRGLHRFNSFKMDDVVDCHQILFANNRVLMCNTGIGALTVFDPMTHKHRQKGWTKLNALSHFNSIYQADSGEFYACFHRKGTSQILRLSVDFAVQEVWKIGKYAHNIYEEDGKLYVCDSFHGQFVEYDPKTKKVSRRLQVPQDFLGGNGWFTRGLARGEGFFLVGLSMVKPRSQRSDDQFSAVIKVSDDFEIEDHYVLPKSGGVTDVRLISELDRAHNGIRF